MVISHNLKNDNKMGGMNPMMGMMQMMGQNPMMRMMNQMMQQQMMMQMMMGGGMDDGKGKGKGKFPKNYTVDSSGGVLGEFIGTIKSGGAKYGFIECPEADKGDIFVHADERKAFRKGQSVKFTLVLTKDGKPNAINLKPEMESGDLGEFSGTIKSGGPRYGFIECPEAGKGDIFLHADERKGYQTGQTVKFTLAMTKDGKPNAINLKSGLH